MVIAMSKIVTTNDTVKLSKRQRARWRMVMDPSFLNQPVQELQCNSDFAISKSNLLTHTACHLGMFDGAY